MSLTAKRISPQQAGAILPEPPIDTALSTSTPGKKAAAKQVVRNVLTVDLEDWPIAVLGPDNEISNRVVDNTKQILRLLRWHGVTATFFVLTKVAHRYPDLIRMVQDDGHELASHGHGHELVTRMSPTAFKDDVARSIDILTNLTGERPRGYRAPAFSIVRQTRWAGQILEDLGFDYDSSIFPIRHPRYGIAGAPRDLHRWDGLKLVECPPATIRSIGRNWPIAGGGYFRLLPGSVVRASVRGLNHRGKPAILYLHPYEVDVDGIAFHRNEGIRVSSWRGLTQALFRSKIEKRLHRLLESFKFETLSEKVDRWQRIS